MDDHVLLREYVEHHSERAFAELVERHLPFVYATALRLARDPHTAQDIAQAVFIQLARKAGTVRDGHALPGWLYRATRYAALVVFRRESRRRQRETEAMNFAEQNTAPDLWSQFAPLLDEALNRLDRADQDAVLLRFFHEKSYREVGVALGLNEDAARKRVDRALEDVRGYFSRRGVTTTAALLGSAITAHATVPPPTVLNATVTNASLTGASTAGVGQLGWKIFFMSTQAKIIITAFIVAAVAAIPITLYLQKTDDQSTPSAQQAIKSVIPSNQPVAAGSSTMPVIHPPAPLRPPTAVPVAKSPTQTQIAPANQIADTQAQHNTILNNLRQISSAAQQFMTEKGVTQASYYDMNSQGYLRPIVPAGNEDYSGIVIEQTVTEISIVGPDGDTITFTQ